MVSSDHMPDCMKHLMLKGTLTINFLTVIMFVEVNLLYLLRYGKIAMYCQDYLDNKFSYSIFYCVC